MALINNLVLAPKDWPGLAEAMSQRQPGDKLTLRVEVEVVENLAERYAFDVGGVEVTDGADDAGEPAEVSPLAESVLGVMAKKRGKK